MEKVTVNKVQLINQRDQIAKELGVKEEVRQLEIDMIVDTGAVAVSLPASMVEQLGLPFDREVKVMRSDGTRLLTRMYKNLMVCIGGRETLTPCLAKPEGAPNLLGQLVLEQIDYVVDCKNQRIIPNPSEEDGIMLFEDF